VRPLFVYISRKEGSRNAIIFVIYRGVGNLGNTSLPIIRIHYVRSQSMPHRNRPCFGGIWHHCVHCDGLHLALWARTYRRTSNRIHRKMEEKNMLKVVWRMADGKEYESTVEGENWESIADLICDNDLVTITQDRKTILLRKEYISDVVVEEV